MRALIVDDEPLARRGVILRLRKYQDVDIVGECADGASAVQKILELSPDIVFLDVQMPGMDGFSVLRALPRARLPAIIFLTAYEQHALQAFEVHALDYLLKPVSSSRLCAAIEEARRVVDATGTLNRAERLLKMLDHTAPQYATRFTVQTGSRLQVVTAESIDWIAASADYMELHVAGRTLLLRETMASLQQRLDPERFLRIHRSRIVHTKKIVELRSIDNREFIVKLADGSEHRSGRTYAESLERWLYANH